MSAERSPVHVSPDVGSSVSPIVRSDPRASPIRLPAGAVASLLGFCLKFVIEDYGRSHAGRTGIGKTDCARHCDAPGRPDSCDLNGFPGRAHTVHHAIRTGARLQFATNAQYQWHGFSLHCKHATCVPPLPTGTAGSRSSRRIEVKKFIPFIAAAALGLGAASAAQAHVSVGVGIGLPIAPAYPVYAAPPPVYYASQ